MPPSRKTLSDTVIMLNTSGKEGEFGKDNEN